MNIEAMKAEHFARIKAKERNYIRSWMVWGMGNGMHLCIYMVKGDTVLIEIMQRNWKGDYSYTWATRKLRNGMVQVKGKKYRAIPS